MQDIDNEFLKNMNKDELKFIKEYETIPIFIDAIKNEFSNLFAFDGEIKYIDFYSDLLKVNGFIHKLNIKNKNIGIFLENNYDFVKYSYGIVLSENVSVHLPIYLNKEDLERYIKKFDIDYIFYSNNTYLISTYDLDIKLINIDEIEYTNISSLEFNKNVSKDQTAFIFLSINEDGYYDGVCLSHENILTGARNGLYGVNNFMYQTYYSILPLTHVYGFIRLTTTSLYSGSNTYYSKNIRRFYKEMKEIKPTILILTPTLMEFVYSLINKFSLDFIGGRLKTIISGGAKSNKDIVLKLNEMGIDTLPGYGLSEASNLVSGNPRPLNYPISAGLLFKDQEYKLIDNVLYLKGKNVFNHYYGYDKEYLFNDGYFNTGDLAHFDEFNNLYIDGVTKDLIISESGENISPKRIERIVNEYDGIIDSFLKYELINGTKSLILLVQAKETLNQETFDNIIKDLNTKLYPHERISKAILSTQKIERIENVNKEIYRRYDCD